MAAAHDLMLSKYKATLLGTLLGDCLGAPYETVSNRQPDVYHIIEMLHKIKTKKKRYFFKYTDDTAFTLAVSQSFRKHNSFNVEELAKQLLFYFEQDPSRGFGGATRILCADLKIIKAKSKLKMECYRPSLESFNGTGSLGNGSGMRVAPIALYTLNMDYDKATIITILATKITHSHPLAVMGALQHCYAIRLALQENQRNFVEIDNINSVLDNFINMIIEYVESTERNIYNIEDKIQRLDSDEKFRICPEFDYYMTILSENKQTYSNDYSNKLKYVKQFYDLCRTGVVIDKQMFYTNVGDCSCNANESIPVALFVFLVASNPNCKNEIQKKINLKDPFNQIGNIERVILYAISFGRDTDTIASMAGAIAGAFWGLESMPSRTVIESCENYKQILKDAEFLYFLMKNNR